MFSMRAIPFFLVFLLASAASAQTYYADVAFDVGDGGQVRVSGLSNHPGLSEGADDGLTAKSGAYWVFNLTLPQEDIFSDHVYEVVLPAGASVNYVKTKGQFSIGTKDGRMIVSGNERDSPLQVIIQYRIADEREWGMEIVLIPLALSIAAFMLLKRKRDKVPEPQDLTERQKDILQAIMDSGEPLTQSQVCEKLGLAKSSVSRNVDTLEKKGYVIKENVGAATFLRYNEPKE